jgi:hypothetical protein
MSHYPTHQRQAFLEWLEAGCPDETTVEEHYEPHTISADELLRLFLHPGCSDVMPGWTCEQVAGLLGDGGRDVHGMTYMIAASAMLVQRAVDDAAAMQFLDKVMPVEEPVEMEG